MPTTTRRTFKLDPICAEATDLAREAAGQSADVFGVGEHVGLQADGERLVTHFFTCPHPGYQGWRWSVTLTRAARAKVATIDEVVLLPGDGALVAETWIPWAERIEPGDVAPGLLMPTPDNDPRLEPGYTGGEHAADADPAEAGLERAVVAELGLGRERVLSREGRDEAVERWSDSAGGPDNQMTKQAPAHCVSCGYFVRLQGSLGLLTGVCANAYSPSDGSVVTIDHGCGGHSDVSAEERTPEPAAPLWDTIDWDAPVSLFD